ncbi:MAG: 16S rRNA (cytidine(1402)-2'-O)-methyltransferase [Alphaproteobacteria bacterium]|nr:16S rRNA (cytidine(1402)-2'-O)-methyltransferase [Alphaproteobacteria bacterium]
MTKTSRSAAPPARDIHLDPGLYIVATPIGNLGDMSARATDTLRAADIIACEDTRVTGKLLAAHDIETGMIAYHEHNAPRIRPQLLRRLGQGAAIALVSDAGTPLISDPGYKLVRSAIDEGVTVTALPGPSAVLGALVVSGLPAETFTFLGFLPARAASRRTAIEDASGLATALVFYESARRLGPCLADLAGILGDRDAAIVRELTKLHEEVRRGRLADLAAHYEAAGAPKGEVVIVVAPPGAPPGTDAGAVATDTDMARAQLLALATEHLSLRDAVDLVAQATGVKRRDVYRAALDLKTREGDEK